MNRSTGIRALAAVMALALLASGAPMAMGYFAPVAAPLQQTAGIAFADPAFQTTWQRTDLPVANGQASRSWLWGPEGFFSGYEPWAESPGGRHLVQYFDKSRMEVNDPNADRTSQWFVTNGLLVVEMMSGKIMTGINSYTQTVAAAIPVAGDASASVNAPTYATTARVASLEGNNRAPNRTGQPVNQILDRAGNVSNASKTQDQVINVVYEATLGHNVPNVFWTFMNQSGIVYENGQYVTGQLFDWVFAMGYPLTEPYWILINVEGKDQWVLMQAYQRRILTFNPNNDPSFQVEMGNVGRSYYDWRYNQQGGSLASPTPVPPTAVATATPAPATLTLNPSSGPSDTTITVAGTGFVPYSAVVVSVKAPAVGYDQPAVTVAADQVGNFSTFIGLPAEVASQPKVTISAFGANGTPNLAQEFTIGHEPQFSVTPLEVTSRGVLDISGTDFTGNTEITLSVYQVGYDQPALQGKVTTDANGNFSGTYTLTGRAPVGAEFNVVATGPNNLSAHSPGDIKIVPQPSVRVSPASGPAGANVVFSGSSWQINRILNIRLQGDDGVYRNMDPVITDGVGNFTANVLVPAEFSGHSKVVLWATDDSSGISANTPYTIVNSIPPPANPQITVSPNPIVSNQPVQVRGTGYPAGQVVSVSAGVVNGPLGPAASTSVNANGEFLATFNLDPKLASAGMVTIAATSTNGTSAFVNVTVINASGGGTQPPPTGLPLRVHTDYGTGAGMVTLFGTGWPAGQGVTANVISADGSVNQIVGASTVAADGSFEISFAQQAPWAGRGDLNVKVTAPSGASSQRYLPVTTITRASSGAYTITGSNWPRQEEVSAQAITASADMIPVGTVITNGSGGFTMNFIPPANVQGTVKSVEVSVRGQEYAASLQP